MESLTSYPHDEDGYNSMQNSQSIGMRLDSVGEGPHTSQGPAYLTQKHYSVIEYKSYSTNRLSRFFFVNFSLRLNLYEHFLIQIIKR